MPTELRRLVEQLEATPCIPMGWDERFNGYGVMGLLFRSAHVLAMHRFPTSSVGHGYTSVWHRTPGGDWVFYANVHPRQAYTRFFGAMASQVLETEIRLAWKAPCRLRVAIRAGSFEWGTAVGATAATRLMNAGGRLLPSIAGLL